MKLLDYIQGNRKGKAAHRTEREAMNDPFLAEALEGFDSVPGDHSEAIHRLQRQVSARSTSRRKHRIRSWSIAAAIVLFLGLGGLYVGLQQNRPDLPPETLANLQEIQHDQASILAPPEPVTAIAQAEQSQQTRSPEEEMAPEPLHQAESKIVDIINIVSDDKKIETAFDFHDFQEATEIPLSAPAPVAEESAEEDIPFLIGPSASRSSAAEMKLEAHRSSTNRNTITGKVVDKNGEPLIGVSIAVKGTSNGAMTDINGAFRIDNIEGTPELIASYLGYASQEIAGYPQSSPVTIALHEDQQSLDEVVVVGYGSHRKRELTGSASATETDRLLETPAAELSGRAAGVSGEEATPLPVDGLESFNEYIRKHKVAQSVTGRVILEFRINRHGRPQNIRVKQSLSEAADLEAIRLLEAGPDWTPTGRTATVTIEL